MLSSTPIPILLRSISIDSVPSDFTDADDNDNDYADTDTDTDTDTEADKMLIRSTCIASVSITADQVCYCS